MGAPVQPGDPPAADQRRSARKRQAILAAATEVFLARGYRGTSMDVLAARAGVSKQTIYKQFGAKRSLFVEIVTSNVDRSSDPVYEEVRSLRDSGDLEADLRDLARRQLASVMKPQLLRLRRLVISEVEHFPELGRAFYERGAGRTVDALADTFARLSERGLLRVEDPAGAASQFNWLIMSAPMNRVMLLGEEEIPSADELDRYADNGVRAFLAAYGPR